MTFAVVENVACGFIGAAVGAVLWEVLNRNETVGQGYYRD